MRVDGPREELRRIYTISRGPDVFRHLGRRSITGRRRKTAGLFALLLACVIGVGAYAFTAANTFPGTHNAGAGVVVVGGYEIKSPTEYTFNNAGTEMTGVTFELDKAASDVQIALTPGEPAQADWKDCGEAEGAPFKVECKFVKAVPDAEGTHLSVAAVSTGKVVIEP
jgi:hypothetical protein